MPSKENKDLAAEFLLEEYKELNNTLHINEERGEKRLEFFVTLSTIVIGAISLLIKEFDKIAEQFLVLIYFVVILFLTALIIIGIIIQNRLRKRNKITDGLKKDIGRIREIFIKNIDTSNEVLPASYSAFANPSKKKTTKRGFTSIFHIASVINCVMIGTAVAFATFAAGLPDREIILISLGVTLAAAIIFIIVNREKQTPSMQDSISDDTVIKK